MCHIFTRLPWEKHPFRRWSHWSQAQTLRLQEELSTILRGLVGVARVWNQRFPKGLWWGVFSEEIGADDLAMISLLLYYLCYWHFQYNFGSNQFVFAQNIKLYFMNPSVTWSKKRYGHTGKAGRQKFRGEAKRGTTCCFWSLPRVKLHKANTHSKWTKTHRSLRCCFFPTLDFTFIDLWFTALFLCQILSYVTFVQKQRCRHWTGFSLPPLRRFSRNKYEMLMIWQEMLSRGLRKSQQKTNKPGLLRREPWVRKSPPEMYLPYHPCMVYLPTFI